MYLSLSLYIYTCIMMYMCMGIWDWEVMCSKVQCFELWFTLRWRPNAPSKAEYCGEFPCMLGLFLVASNLMPAVPKYFQRHCRIHSLWVDDRTTSSKMVIVPGTPMGPRTSANGRTALKKKPGSWWGEQKCHSFAIHLTTLYSYIYIYEYMYIYIYAFFTHIYINT